MAVGVQAAWSLAPNSNGAADANIGYPEGQTPASLNNSARSQMAAIKGFANQILGAKTTGGSANAQTYTSDSVAAISGAYAAGMGFVFKAGFSNSGACTFNADGVGAKSIKKGGAQAALAANDMVANGVYFVVYEASGDCFVLLNPESGQVALDPTLTALAGLSTSASQYIRATGTDTFTMDSYATVLSNIAALGLAGSQTVTGAKVFSGGLSVESATQSQLKINRADGSIGFIIGRSIGGANGQDFFIYDNVAAATRLSINSSGAVNIPGAISAGATTVTTIATTLGASFGQIVGGTPVVVDRVGNGTLIDLQLSSASQGSISGSGTTISYNAFMGSHWAQFTGWATPDLLLGTIVDSISEMCLWRWDRWTVITPATVDEDGAILKPEQRQQHQRFYFGELQPGDSFEEGGLVHTIIADPNDRLPRIKVSDTRGSRAVYGVYFARSDEDGAPDYYVAALGAGYVRIAPHETPAIGDLIESNGDGCGRVQANDLMRASTVAKITSTERVCTHPDGSYVLPCTLHCG